VQVADFLQFNPKSLIGIRYRYCRRSSSLFSANELFWGMSLADREYQRAHRTDHEFQKPGPPRSKLWFWIVVVILILVAMRYIWPPIH
jgi:hypothetical protein